MSCPECNGRGEVPTEDREWVPCETCHVRTPTRAERQVAAVREVLRWLENGPLFSTRRKYGEAATVIYQRAAKALRRALDVK